jgi:hypothetical protein
MMSLPLTSASVTTLTVPPQVMRAVYLTDVVQHVGLMSIRPKKARKLGFHVQGNADVNRKGGPGERTSKHA